VALKWFFNLKDSRTNTWEDICSKFFKQYQFNNAVDVTRRDLETTKQDAKETFSSFITRWRAKAVQMTSQPNEEDQLQMVVKNLLTIYNKHLFAQYFPTFKALVAAGIQIEDALQASTNQDWSSKLQGHTSPKQSPTPPKSHTSFTIPHTPQKALQAKFPKHLPTSTKGPTSLISP
jgi:hypothetical protein